MLLVLRYAELSDKIRDPGDNPLPGSSLYRRAKALIQCQLITNHGRMLAQSERRPSAKELRVHRKRLNLVT